MRKIFYLLVLTVVFGISQLHANTYFLFMKIYNPDGAMGNSSTANSFSSVAAYRVGIANQIGRQESGPDSTFPNKVYRSHYDNAEVPAYFFSDVGSYDWTLTESAGQTVVAVAEVYSPQFGWTGNSYIGYSKDVLYQSDINKNQIELPDAKLQMIPQPQIIQQASNSVTVGWQSMTLNDITGYTLYRSSSINGTYTAITIVPQSTGQIQCTDNFNITGGTTYYYKISVNFAWGGGNGAPAYYETKAMSAASSQPGTLTSNPKPEENTPVPEELSESNTYNYPNPCAGPTTIRFSLLEQENVSIAIYDINSRLVWSKKLDASSTTTGVNNVIWKLQNDAGIEVSNGAYILVIKAGGKTVTKKIAVVR